MYLNTGRYLINGLVTISWHVAILGRKGKERRGKEMERKKSNRSKKGEYYPYSVSLFNIGPYEFCKKQGRIFKKSGGGERFFWLAIIYTPGMNCGNYDFVSVSWDILPKIKPAPVFPHTSLLGQCV